MHSSEITEDGSQHNLCVNPVHIVVGVVGVGSGYILINLFAEHLNVDRGYIGMSGIFPALFCGFQRFDIVDVVAKKRSAASGRLPLIPQENAVER